MESIAHSASMKAWLMPAQVGLCDKEEQRKTGVTCIIFICFGVQGLHVDFFMQKEKLEWKLDAIGSRGDIFLSVSEFSVKTLIRIGSHFAP
jgi:hypothetical protein